MSSILPLKRLYYLIRFLIGIILIVIGFIITPLPIPIGLILIFVGLTLIAYDSNYLKKQIIKFRKHYPAVSEKLKKLEPYSFFYYVMS